MNNLELYRLVRNSKLAQVATPLSKQMRGTPMSVPTHQVVHTPKDSALRSNFGMKSTLPKQIGTSHIAYNLLDSASNIPDVEKMSTPHYTRLRFQELGYALQLTTLPQAKLFAHELSRLLHRPAARDAQGGLLALLNVNPSTPLAQIRAYLKKYPQLYSEFKRWKLENIPASVDLKVPVPRDEHFRQFIASGKYLQRTAPKLRDFTRTKKTQTTPHKRDYQGTAGLSYLQSGRLANTPNGFRHGVVAPARLVKDREVVVGGIVAPINDKTVSLQARHAANYPGKHLRQFVFPVALKSAKLLTNGSLHMSTEAVQVGKWMLRIDAETSEYVATDTNFSDLSERNAEGVTNLADLLDLIEPHKKGN